MVNISPYIRKFLKRKLLLDLLFEKRELSRGESLGARNERARMIKPYVKEYRKDVNGGGKWRLGRSGSRGGGSFRNAITGPC